MAAPLATFAPDADSTTPGVLTDAQHVIPGVRGLKPAPSAASTLLPALANTCIGGATLVRLDSQVRLFAGTTSNLYEAAASSWTDVSRVSGAYTTVNERWRFSQYGNVSLAVSKENVLQATTSGAFANVSGAPKASIIETVGAHVIIANTDDGGSYGDRPDSWWACALGDYTDWTPSIATGCYTGTLTSIAGKITALRRFGTQVFVGKERGCYLGSFQGPPFGYPFEEIPSESGPVSQEACIFIGTPEQPKLFYVARDDFYVFAGDRPVPVGQGVKQYFLNSVNPADMDKIICAHDRLNSLVYVFYPSSSSGLCDKGLVFNYRQGKWGVSNRTIEFALDYQGNAITYDDLGTLYPTQTYDDLAAVPYDQLYATLANVGAPGVFDSSHNLKVLNGTPEVSSIITGDFGSDMQFSLLKRVKPAWMQKPTAATLTSYCRDSLGDDLTLSSEAVMSDSRFDLLVSARWHRLKLEMQGAWEANRFEFVTTPQGME